MMREWVSDDRVARKKWPVLFWLNRVAFWALIALVCVWVALLVLGRFVPDENGTINGAAGAAFLLGAASGLVFVVSGYVRLYKVHGIPGRAPRKRPARPSSRLVGVVVGVVILSTAILRGSVTLGLETAIVVVVVVGLLYLAQRLR